MVTKFGDIALANSGLYSSKPRPVLVFQNDLITTGTSLIVIPFTSEDNQVFDFRIAVMPSTVNGLRKPCWLEVEKISAIRADAIGQVIGVLEEDILATVIATSRRIMSESPIGD